jgi:membrane protein implicated in regulation of membrane protease activity
VVSLTDLYLTHPAWGWAAAGAALLAAELATSSGWLLWPAAAAGLVAVLQGIVWLSPPGAVMTFALLTIVLTATARRYFPPRFRGGAHDINDNAARLVGHEGRAVSAFRGRSGRVFIDGKEWAAELEGAETLEPGARVEVVSVAGARLTVRCV